MKVGTYQTIQKQLILKFLEENEHQFVTANDIMQYLVKHNQKVGLTTIYRFLNTLEEAGLLRIENIKNTRCFQFIKDECKSHFHLKCDQCGKIEHFDCKEMHEFCQHIGKEHGFYINPQNTIGGLCKKCQKKKKEIES